ncbi:hypothetical protein [Gaoshiqia sp. Z1-71]
MESSTAIPFERLFIHQNKRSVFLALYGTNMGSPGQNDEGVASRVDV